MPEKKNKPELAYSSKPKTVSNNVKDFYIPILSLCVFFAILVFFSIPKVKETIGFFEQKKQLEATLEQKQIELKDLQVLREKNVENSALLNKLDQIIPAEPTDVLAFQDKVSKMSFDNLIKITNQRIGERFLDDEQKSTQIESDKQIKTLSLVRITTEFELVGEIANFRSMLSDIYSGSDFIVITQMELNNPKTGSATMKIILSKYQYQNPFRNDISGVEEKEFLNTVSYKDELDQEVVDFIERKSQIKAD